MYNEAVQPPIFRGQWSDLPTNAPPFYRSPGQGLSPIDFVSKTRFHRLHPHWNDAFLLIQIHAKTGIFSSDLSFVTIVQYLAPHCRALPHTV